MPRPVHWVIFVIYFFVGLGYFVHTDELSKKYLSNGGAEERARVMRWISALFALGLIGLPYAWLLDQRVFPEGVITRAHPVTNMAWPGLYLITALFYGVKVLRYSP